MAKIKKTEVVKEQPQILNQEEKLEQSLAETAEPAKVLEESIVEQVVLEKKGIEEPAKNDQELTKEQRIDKFLEDKPKEEIKMNDFLKSLFQIQPFPEPAIWANQTSSKEIRILLDKMQSEGKLEVLNNTHIRLGKVYYPDAVTGKAAYYSLQDTPITCVKK